jgi:hypothetical protein
MEGNGDVGKEITIYSVEVSGVKWTHGVRIPN